MRQRFVYSIIALLAVGILTPNTLLAEASGPTYFFSSLRVPEGDNSFAEKGPGDDMLPYTDDDTTVAGNPFGSLGFQHFDNNANNAIDEGEAVFNVVTNDDDDSTLYSPQSRPEYGLISESEDWYEYWHQDLAGPNRDGILVDTGLTDYEINDWNGWTDESNAYVYNNLGANQHGLGLPMYRVDYRSVPSDGNNWVFDEVEQYKKSFGLRNTGDDPDTAFNERGGCRRFKRARDEIDLRGYLIPTENLGDLADGSLPALFPDWMANSTLGGEATDMAAYLRDVLAPVVDDPNAINWCECGVAPEVLLPPTYVYLFQVEIDLLINNGEGECGGSDDPVCADAADPGLCQLQNHAAYWGIPNEGGKARMSHVLVGSPDVQADVQFGEGAVHVFQTTPDDDGEWNLWLQDHFWRDGDNPPLGGGYASVGEVQIVPEPGLSVVDEVDDSVLRFNDAGSVSASLSRGVGAGELPIIAAADLALDIGDLTAIPEGGEGAGLAGSFQLILRSGNNVVAYADIGADQTQVHLGGTFDPATGLASAPASSGDPGAGADLQEVDTVAQLGADYSRYVLMVTSEGASLREIEGAIANEYTDLTASDPIATVGGAPNLRSGVNALSLAASGQSVANTLLVFASPGTGPFTRGDCNGDGSNDVSDGVTVLNFAFLGTDAPGCLASCDFNADGNLDVTNAVYYFSALFLGGSPIPAPTGSPAYSQQASDASVGCANPSV